MKTKKILLLFVVLIVFGILMYLLFDKSKNYNILKKSMQKDINYYKSENEKLTKDLENLNDKLDNYTKRECKYTKTYRYISDYAYEYQDYAPKTSRFIVVDRFQFWDPTIFEIDKKKFNIDFQKNHMYEITFITYINNGFADSTSIIDVKETDKEGLEQVQESCKILE